MGRLKGGGKIKVLRIAYRLAVQYGIGDARHAATRSRRRASKLAFPTQSVRWIVALAQLPYLTSLKTLGVHNIDVPNYARQVLKQRLPSCRLNFFVSSDSCS